MRKAHVPGGHDLVRSLLTYVNVVHKMVASTKAVRELKYRSPALMGYAEALVEMDATYMEDLPELNLAGERDMRTLACAVGAAMNDKVRSSGCSAYQCVFGKSKFEALQAMDRLNEAVRTAILRKSHPAKELYHPGELVAFCREAKYRQGKKGQKGKRVPASWYRGTIIGPHKGDSSVKQSNYWVASGGRCVLVAQDQLRPAFGTGLWPVHEHILHSRKTLRTSTMT